ncbi:MAG: hypothetical protein ABSH20_14830 [Tepidisphaeraceae bacterium]|jgi:hypothetical protein
MANDANRPRPQEQEAIRTTIVGGRPPGCGKAVGGVPRGIEVLVKKAAVDPEFRSLLLTERGQAARSIGLELSAAESMMLSAVPAAQLRSIIAATTVPQTHMPAFLGKVAAVMLAALGIVQAGCDDNRNAKPAGIRPEDMPKDNAAAAATCPAEAADAQQQVITTVAGVVNIRPLTRPATQPTQPVTPVAGAMINRPEATNILGIGPDTPLILDKPADDPLVAMAGVMADKPETRPPTSEITLRFPDARADNPAAITGGMAYGMAGHMAEPATIRFPTVRADNPAPIAGERIDRPPEPVEVAGLTADTTTRPATRPATEPATPQPPEVIVVLGARPARPENVTMLGLRADVPPRPATQPTTRPAASQPSPNITYFGLMIDRPQNTAIRGLRADIPPVAPTTQPITQPTTRPAADAPAPVPIAVFGGIADRPVAIRGIRVDRPDTSTTAPTTQPAAQSPQPEPPMIIAGIMPTPPTPASEPLSRGIRPDRPPAPTSQPAAQTDPDFPIAIDGIRPDRPKPNNP